MKIRSPLLTYVAARSMVSLCRALFRTLKIEFGFARPEVNPFATLGPERFIYCVWHDSVIGSIFVDRHPRTVALVSRHQDGSYLARGLQMLGIRTVRGSSKHGGATAIRQLIASTEDKHIVITPDGPRGPRREVKTGMVFLASHTGRAIVPTAFTYKRLWRIPGSWTDLAVPKPFTQVYALAGESIAVPPNLSRADLERYTKLVQDAMDALNAKAEALAAESGAVSTAEAGWKHAA